MSYIDIVMLTCKNNLCKKTANVHRTNGRMPNPMTPCPHCGFKTLDDTYIPPEITAMIERLKLEPSNIEYKSK